MKTKYTAPFLQCKSIKAISAILPDFKDKVEAYEAIHKRILNISQSDNALSRAKKERLQLKDLMTPIIQDYKKNPNLWIQTNYESTAKEAVA